MEVIRKLRNFASANFFFSIFFYLRDKILYIYIYIYIYMRKFATYEILQVAIAKFMYFCLMLQKLTKNLQK